MKLPEQWVLFGERRGFTMAMRQAQAEAYEAGQRDMREAAQQSISENFGAGMLRANEIIRSTPIKSMPESTE